MEDLGSCLLLIIKLRFWLVWVLSGMILLYDNSSLSAQIRYQGECFMILAGKDATADGSVLLAHNNDLTGKETSHLIQLPGRQFQQGDSVSYPSGLKIPQVAKTFQWMVLKILKGYAEGDAVAINEWGVAIAGGVALKSDRNSHAEWVDPLLDIGLTGGIRYTALQRARTARQCVKILGSLYTKYGVTYPSGVGIADASEVWYIESGGGHTWAAVRVPDSCYWPQANGYRIAYVDPADTMNYYCMPGLLEFCKEHDLWNPDKGRFHFAEAFGGGRRENKLKPYYDTRRIWRCIDLLNPQMKAEPGISHYPCYLKPDNKITLNDCFRILRDRYEGSIFENNTDDSGKKGERAIASSKAVHSDVIQLFPGMPVETGAIMWVGIGQPKTTFYTPCYYGMKGIPDAFEYTSAKPDEDFLFWKIRKLSDLAAGDEEILKQVSLCQEAFEKAAMESVAGVQQLANIKEQSSTGSSAQFLFEVTAVYTEQIITTIDSLNLKFEMSMEKK